MRVLVSDTSVLIDLERGDLLDAAFELSVELAVPDILYRRELEGFGGEALLARGLRVEELDEKGVGRAQGFRRARTGLSVPDSFALALALGQGWTLLTGDGLLRELAGLEGVECHGVLWLIDLMNHEEVVGIQALRDGLGRIADHPRCRLPGREVRARLDRYARLLAGNGD